MRKRLNYKHKILSIVLLLAVLVGLLTFYLSHHNVAVLDPAGQIGLKERHLFIIGIILSAIVVIPVYFITIMIAIKYREDNPKKVAYSPDWDHSRVYESIWWGIPLVIIAILSVITWNSSHALDPYKPIASKTPALTVEVVALDWKWLFIYPGQNIASVNQLKIPVNTPVNFYLTSDSVMNSFWVPRLGGQIYAMPGMSTELHLIANKNGNYYGSSANISGSGFASMNFMTIASSNSNFNDWVNSVKASNVSLNQQNYSNLAKPSAYYPVKYYSQVTSGLYNQIINKYMTPSPQSSSGNQSATVSRSYY